MTPGLRRQRAGGRGLRAARPRITGLRAAGPRTSGLRAAGLGLLLLLVAAAYVTRLPYAAAASYDDIGRFPSRPPSPSASASPTPSAEASRAGNQAGEGRARPGRQEPVPRDEDAGPSYTDRDPDGGEDADEPDSGDSSEVGDSAERPDSPEATDASEPPAEAAQPPAPPADAADRSTVRSSGQEPVLQILPLGSGLILIGCGLGLAFLALRVRRG